MYYITYLEGQGMAIAEYHGRFTYMSIDLAGTYWSLEYPIYTNRELVELVLECRMNDRTYYV